MKKNILLIIVVCLFLTACGEIPEQPDDQGVKNEATVPAEKDFGAEEERCHMLGSVVYVGEDYYVAHIVGDGYCGKNAYSSVEGELYVMIAKSLVEAERKDDLLLEYVGEVQVVDETIKNHDVPEEYMALLPEATGHYLVPEKIEKAEKVENDGVLKGWFCPRNGVVSENADENYEADDVIIPFEEEYEGAQIRIHFYASQAEVEGEMEFWGEVMVYYDTDTFDVIRVVFTNSGLNYWDF